MIEDLSHLIAIEELRSRHFQPSARVRRGYRGAARIDADARDDRY
jgi:hypothetical protein